MPHEIERKFFVRELPSLDGISPLRYERYFLSREGGKEVRIQKVNDKYMYEEKNVVSDLERTTVKKEITEEEFNALKAKSVGRAIIRDRYDISRDPDVVIQIYRGDLEGLIRAEVEFRSRAEAEAFRSPEWMGKEMTGLPIARDSMLIDLSPEDVKRCSKVHAELPKVAEWWTREGSP